MKADTRDNTATPRANKPTAGKSAKSAVNVPAANNAGQPPRRWKRKPPLIERRDRTRRGLIHVLNIIKNKPTFLVHLSVDKDQHPEMYMDITQFSPRFAEFKARMAELHTTCWFIWKIEWKLTAGFHVHMVGDLDGNPNRLRARRLIKHLWDSCFGHASPHSKRFKSVVVDIHKTNGGKYYLVKKKKRRQELKCVALLKWKHALNTKLYGYIRPKNIDDCKEHKLRLSAFEYEKFHTYVMRVLREKKTVKYYPRQYLDREKSYEFFDRQFRKNIAWVHFIPHKLMKRAYKYIKALRRRIFPDVPPTLRKFWSFSENQYHAYKLLKIQRNLNKLELSAISKKSRKRRPA